MKTEDMIFAFIFGLLGALVLSWIVFGAINLARVAMGQV